MARGDMRFESVTIGGQIDILNRSPFEGVPMTINFTSVTDTDDETGEKVVKAGTPINASGVPVSATPWTGATGILLHDVYERRPQGTVLTKAYINVTRAQKNSGLTYDGALITAMNSAGNRIRLEAPNISVPASGD